MRDALADPQGLKLTQDEAAATQESLGKCINPATGEPVSARKEETAVLPVKGSRTASDDGNGRGTCPHCSAHVKLSGKGFITAHAVRRNPVPVPPPTVKLAEREPAVTESGSRVGSPDASMRSRTAELSGALGTGTVRIKVRNEQGRTEEKDVPATPDNIRTALRQERKRKHPDAKLLHRLGSMLRGATGSEAVPVPGAMPGTYRVREAVTLDAPSYEERARDDGSVAHVPTSPGPALVRGVPMAGKVPTDRQRVTHQGKPRNAIGWSEPLGRDRPDRVVITGDAGVCKGRSCDLDGCAAIVGGTHGYLSCAVFRTLGKRPRRRYWEHVATNRSRAQRAAETARRQKDAATRGGRQWPVTRAVMGADTGLRIAPAGQ